MANNFNLLLYFDILLIKFVANDIFFGKIKNENKIIKH